MGAEALAELRGWPARARAATEATYSYKVRERPVTGENYTESLARLPIPKLAVPRFRDWGELLHFILNENLPGAFPYTGGVYPYRREEEDPTRMFAGEGGPERTNRRFHYVAAWPRRRAPVDRVRFDDALWRGPGHASGCLRAHRQLGRLDRHAR